MTLIGFLYKKRLEFKSPSTTYCNNYEFYVSNSHCGTSAMRFILLDRILILHSLGGVFDNVILITLFVFF